MAGLSWMLLTIGWIASDLLVKLLLDSVEQIYIDEIESTVKQLPRKIKQISSALAMTTRNRLLIAFLEAVRILAIVFFLPLFLLLSLIPFLRRIRYFKTQFQFLQTLFSRDWMVFALVLTEAFSWKGFLFCILGFLRLSAIDQANADTGQHESH